MLLVIHNIPNHMRFFDVKSLIEEKCGLSEVILDKFTSEGDNKRVTVGLADEGDAALLVRKLNGLYLDGCQLYVEDVRQKKASEHPYRHIENPEVPNNRQQQYEQRPTQYEQPQRPAMPVSPMPLMTPTQPRSLAYSNLPFYMSPVQSSYTGHDNLQAPNNPQQQGAFYQSQCQQPAVHPAYANYSEQSQSHRSPAAHQGPSRGRGDQWGEKHDSSLSPERDHPDQPAWRDRDRTEPSRSERGYRRSSDRDEGRSSNRTSQFDKSRRNEFDRKTRYERRDRSPRNRDEGTGGPRNDDMRRQHSSYVERSPPRDRNFRSSRRDDERQYSSDRDRRNDHRDRRERGGDRRGADKPRDGDRYETRDNNRGDQAYDQRTSGKKRPYSDISSSETYGNKSNKYTDDREKVRERDIDRNDSPKRSRSNRNNAIPFDYSKLERASETVNQNDPSLKNLMKKHNTWRYQIASTLAVEVISSRNRVEHTRLPNYHELFKKLKACVVARLDVLLEDRIVSSMKEMRDCYRARFPPEDDVPFLNAVKEKIKRDDQDQGTEDDCVSDADTAKSGRVPPPASPNISSSAANLRPSVPPFQNKGPTAPISYQIRTPTSAPPFQNRALNPTQFQPGTLSQTRALNPTPQFSVNPPNPNPYYQNFGQNAAPRFEIRAPTSTPQFQNRAPTSTPQFQNTAPASTPQFLNRAPTSTPQFQNTAPASTPQFQNRAPTSARQFQNRAPTSASQFQNRAPTSAPQFQNNAPTSAPQFQNRAPTSAPQFQNRAPTSAPQFQNKAPTSAPQFQNRAPTSAPQFQNRAPTATPQLQSRVPAATPQFQNRAPTATPRFQNRTPMSAPRFQNNLPSLLSTPPAHLRVPLPLPKPSKPPKPAKPQPPPKPKPSPSNPIVYTTKKGIPVFNMKQMQNNKLYAKKQINKSKKLLQMEFRDEVVYETDPLVKKAIEDEIDSMLELYMTRPDNYMKKCEFKVHKKIINETPAIFKKVMSLNLTKRILDITTGLVLRVFPAQPGKWPQHDSFNKFMAQHGIVNVKKCPKMYVVTCGTFDAYDKMAAIDTINVDGVSMLVKVMHVAGPRVSVREKLRETRFNKDMTNDDDEDVDGNDDGGDHGDDGTGIDNTNSVIDNTNSVVENKSEQDDVIIVENDKEVIHIDDDEQPAKDDQTKLINKNMVPKERKIISSLTPEQKEMRKNVRKLFKTAKQTRLPDDWVAYNSAKFDFAQSKITATGKIPKRKYKPMTPALREMGINVKLMLASAKKSGNSKDWDLYNKAKLDFAKALGVNFSVPKYNVEGNKYTILTPEQKEMRRTIKRFYKRAIRSGLPKHWDAYALAKVDLLLSTKTVGKDDNTKVPAAKKRRRRRNRKRLRQAECLPVEGEGSGAAKADNQTTIKDNVVNIESTEKQSDKMEQHETFEKDSETIEQNDGALEKDATIEQNNETPEKENVATKENDVTSEKENITTEQNNGIAEKGETNQNVESMESETIEQHVPTLGNEDETNQNVGTLETSQTECDMAEENLETNLIGDIDDDDLEDF